MVESITIRDQDLNKLNRVLDLIGPADIEKKEGCCEFFDIIATLFWRCVTSIKRSANYVFGDRVWYDEARARKIVKHYLWHANLVERNDERAKTIAAIWDKLARVGRGEGNWAERIERGLIEELQGAQDSGFVRVKGQPACDTRTFFHIHANEFGKNSKLEGHEFIKPLEHIFGYIKARKEHPKTQRTVSDELVKEVEGALDLARAEDFVASAKSKIEEAFREKKRMLVASGWKGKPGHCMYYEIIPDGQDRASFRIYNTGAGSGNHAGAVIGNKEKHLPYCEWKGIRSEKVKNDNFWAAIKEMNSQPANGFAYKEYDSNDAYEGLRKLLEPQDETQPENAPLDSFMSPQLAGICTERSLMAFLRERLGHDEYKRFRCSLKLQTLVDKVKSVKKETPSIWERLIDLLPNKIATFIKSYFFSSSEVAKEKDKPLDARLIEKSRQKLALSVGKLFQKQIIGKAFLTSASFKLAKLDRYIEDAKEQRLEIQALKEPEGFRPLGNSFHEKQVVQLPTPLFKQVEGSFTVPCQTYSFIAEKIGALPSDDASQMASTLSMLQTIAQKGWLEGEDFATHSALINWISKLSMDKKFWEEAAGGSKRAEQMITKLAQIGQILFKTCFKVPDSPHIMPDRIYALLKIQFIQRALLDSINAQFAHNLGIDAGKSVLNTLLFTLRDARKMDEFTRCKRDLHSWRRSFNENTSYNAQDKELYINFSRNYQSSVALLVESMLSHFPELLPSLRSEIPGLDDMPNFERASRMYAANSLPPWAKAIRDTNFYYQHLLQAPVGNPAIVDRQNDFTLEYSVRAETDSASLVVSMSGITPEVYNDPEVRRVNSYSKTRFEGCHRPCAETPLKKFVRYLLERDSTNEKPLLADHAKNLSIDMPDEEFKELAHLFLLDNSFFTGKENQLFELLAFFTKHPEKLKSLDHQTLFTFLFFKTKLLPRTLQRAPFAYYLDQFLNANIERFLNENEIQAAIFLLRMMRYTQQFCPATRQSLGILHQVKERPGLEPHEKSLIFQEIIAHLGSKISLSEEEVAELLLAHTHIKDVPLPSKWSDPMVEFEVEQVLHTHARRVQHFLANSPAFLNTLLQALRPGVASKHWNAVHKVGEFPHYVTSDGKHLFYPLEGRFISLETEVMLPVVLAEHPHFKALFPTVKKALAKPGHIFQFTDSKGRQTVVRLVKDELIIEQQMGPSADSWHRFVPPSAFLTKDDKKKSLTSSFSSRYLNNHYVHFQKIDDPTRLMIVNKTTHEMEYEATITGTQVTRVVRKQDGCSLSVPSATFAHFEDPSYIQEWYTDNQVLAGIQLPRSSLSFVPGNDGRLWCEQHPGYFACKEQTVSELSIYRHYLVIQNEAGHKKVLMPTQPFVESSVGHEPLLPLYGIDDELRESDIKDQAYVVFDVQEEGTLFSKSLEANFYLAQVFALIQEYDKAAKILRKKGAKLTPYTDKEKLLLRAFAKPTSVTGDQDGDAYALRAFASFLLLKNSHDHHYHLSNAENANCKENYLSYLKHYRKIQVLHLHVQEELALLYYLLGQGRNELFGNRIKELDPGYRTIIAEVENELPHAKRPLANSSSLALSFHSLKPLPADRLKGLLITRPYSFLCTHFTDIIRLAKEGSTLEKKKICDSLAFLATSSDTEESNLAYFLQSVFEHPEKFTESPGSTYETFNQWVKDALSTAKEILAEKPKIPPQSSNVAKPVNRTPVTFRLQQPDNHSLNFPISYALPAHNAFADHVKEAHLFTETKEKAELVDNSFAHYLANLPNADPVEHKEIVRLQKDLQVHENNGFRTRYTFAQEDNMGHVLVGAKEENERRLKELTLQIESLANRAPALSVEKAKQMLRIWGGLQKTVRLDDVLITFATQDTERLKKQNPALEPRDLEELYTKAAEYLLLATFEQQRQRAKGVWEKLCEMRSVQNLGSMEEQDLNQLLGELMSAKRCYDPKTNPAYLVFEYYADLVLRPLQKEKLDHFLAGENSNIVMEMIMGSGKSKVLLPLLGLLRAKGETLSLLVVPQALFESIASDTQDILQRSFGKQLRTFHFDRNTRFTSESLQTILADLKGIQKNHECLIMTSKSVQCLLLKLVDASDQYFANWNEGKSPPMPEELKLLQEIVATLGKDAHPLIDEADTILNVLHEVCFSLGARSNPDPNDIALISELYDLLLTDPEMKKLGGLECDRTRDVNAPTVTEEVYLQTIRKALAQKFFERLKSMKFDAQNFTDQVNTFAMTLSQEEQSLALDYLTRDGNKALAQNFYNRQNTAVQHVLALAGEEISTLLRHTLTRNCDEKYGLDDELSGLFAIPYSAANVPHQGSQFANPFITMNYTFQTYLKKGVTRSHLMRAIEKIQRDALQEMMEGGIGMPLQNTKAWAQFCKLKGTIDMPLFNFKEEQFALLDQKVNTSLAAKREFVTVAILPQLELYAGKLSCNPLTLIAFFKIVSGFTGTLWNGASMHRKLRPEPEAGTDAKTLKLLWEKSRNAVHVVREGPTKDMLHQLRNFHDFDMIADAGGYFKEGGNLQIARELALQANKPVAFYNTNGEQTVTSGTSEMPLGSAKVSESERLTFLDQSHTTGADVKQKRTAVSIVTIGRNMLLRDLLQSAWRLRGLDKLQKVVFAVSQEVESIIRQDLKKVNNDPLTFEDILRFVIRNQAKQQGSDNFKAFMQELYSIPQMLLVNALTSDHLTASDKAKAHRMLRDVWIKPANLSARELFGNIATIRKSRDLVLEQSIACKEILKKCFDEIPGLHELGIDLAAVEKEIYDVAAHMQESLPDEIVAKDSSKATDVDQTVEVQTQTQTQTQLEEEEHTQTEKVHLGLMHGMIDKVDAISDDTLFKMYVPESNHRVQVRAFSLETYMKQHATLKEYADAFKDLSTTINVLEWPKISPRLADCELLGSHRTPLHYVAIDGNDVILLSDDDARRELMWEVDLYNITLGYCDKIQLATPNIKKKIVITKFLNGESHYTKEESEMLREWFEEVGATRMRKLYCDHIISGYPLKAQNYQHSALQKLFGEMVHVA